MWKWSLVLTATSAAGCLPEPPPDATQITAVASAIPAAEATGRATRSAAREGLAAAQRELLDAWYDRIGPRREGEKLGRLIVRAGRLQLGRAYRDPPQTAQQESLQIDLSTFQCVSFVESTLAVERCTWKRQQTAECFVDEVTRFRYRDGTMDGYGSRLHYFSDWLEDNTERQRLTDVSTALGGRPEPFVFNYMSRHPGRYPAMSTDGVADQIAAAEQRLSASPRIVVDRRTAKRTESALEPGDLIAIVSSKHPGLLIRHAGFVDPGARGQPRLLHASSHQKRVMVRRDSIAQYLAARPDRRGMVVARPLPP
jgi:hypothetical protein